MGGIGGTVGIGFGATTGGTDAGAWTGLDPTSTGVGLTASRSRYRLRLVSLAADPTPRSASAQVKSVGPDSDLATNVSLRELYGRNAALSLQVKSVYSRRVTVPAPLARCMSSSAEPNVQSTCGEFRSSGCKDTFRRPTITLSRYARTFEGWTNSR